MDKRKKTARGQRIDKPEIRILRPRDMAARLPPTMTTAAARRAMRWVGIPHLWQSQRPPIQSVDPLAKRRRKIEATRIAEGRGPKILWEFSFSSFRSPKDAA